MQAQFDIEIKQAKVARRREPFGRAKMLRSVHVPDDEDELENQRVERVLQQNLGGVDDIPSSVFTLTTDEDLSNYTITSNSANSYTASEIKR